MAPRFEDLKAEYADLWQRMEIRPDRRDDVNRIARRLLGSKTRYQAVSRMTGVPWFVIAVIHNRELESDTTRFQAYLGNGEPLNRVTRLVPRGRGPFDSWEAGAVDALHIDHLDEITDWSIERACYALETFNGFGYRRQHPPVNSPYLWSFSTNYSSGKFVSDGVFNPDVVDKQCGAMPIIKEIMALDPTATFAASAAPAAQAAMGALAFGSRGDRVRDLQTALKQRGFDVGDIDGIYGTQTRDAVTAFQRSASLTVTGIADAATLAALAVDRGPIVVGGVPSGHLQPADILRILLGEVARADHGLPPPNGIPPATGTPPATGAANDILRQVIAALLGKSAVVPGSALPGSITVVPPTILTPIDKMLGGSSLAGGKTALSIVAGVVMSLLHIGGVVPATAPASMIIDTLIGVFGGLGGLSKIDRIVQTMAIIAAKRPG